MASRKPRVWKDDGLVVHWGYQNPWRIEMLGTNLVQLDLRTLLATKQQPQGQFHESDLRMVSMFLWEQGKFQRFLQLIQQQKKDGYESYFERQLHRFAPTAFLAYKRKSSEPT